jgi:5-carboxymethyl-2-hydroxymuconate isomerase
MPHVIVEYSANLESAIDVRQLLRNVHEAVLASGVFEVGAVRTRATRHELAIVADGDRDNGFVHVEVRMAPGREAAARKSLANAILSALAADTRELYARTGLGLSVEVRELDYTAAVRLNNLHERMAAKGRAAQAVP